MMNLKTGYPYPLIRSGLPYDYPKLEKNISTDVLVLGGGISGALVAHYLIKEGIDCVVVDARTIGLGSTAASTSLLQYEIDTPLSELVRLVGYKNAVKAYKLCGHSIHKLGALAKKIGLHDFRYKPSLHYALTTKDSASLKEEHRLLTKNGFRVKLLGEASIKKEFGFKSPGALLSELGADTNAYLFTHLLHQYNIPKGLKVFDRSPAEKIRHEKTGVNIGLANGFRIKAKKIVYATGYEVVDFISKPIVKLKTTFATISEPISDPLPYWKHDALIWSTGDPYLYLRSTPDHRIIVGGKDINSINQTTVQKLLNTKTRTLKKDVNRLFPNLHFIPEFSWAGVFGSTKDGLPFIGPYKKLTNSYFTLGFGGNGITFSQVAGEIVAALIKGKISQNASIFSFDRA